MPRAAIRSILAATDLSPASDDILRAADALAARTGAELHVMTALELPRPPAAAEEEENQHALDAQVRRLLPGREAATCRVVYDAPHRAILERAAQVAAELAVLGSHRAGRVNARFLGTTTDRVLRAARIPSLVVRAPLSLPLRRVGVPTDFSPHAREALEVALAWSAGLDDGSAEVWGVHAAAAPERDGSGARLEEELREACARTGMDPARVSGEVVRAADPVQGIVAWAKRRGAGLLVAGTRGSGAGRSDALGGTASALALRAGCPVLLVPTADGRG